MVTKSETVLNHKSSGTGTDPIPSAPQQHGKHSNPELAIADHSDLTALNIKGFKSTAEFIEALEALDPPTLVTDEVDQLHKAALDYRSGLQKTLLEKRSTLDKAPKLQDTLDTLNSENHHKVLVEKSLHTENRLRPLLEKKKSKDELLSSQILDYRLSCRMELDQELKELNHNYLGPILGPISVDNDYFPSSSAIPSTGFYSSDPRYFKFDSPPPSSMYPANYVASNRSGLDWENTGARSNYHTEGYSN
ncbi:hypothetical protein M422DRAFT_70310, partial [Sphaerobolus stellatus SS14]